MAARLGANTQREWDSEPFPGELWNALKRLEEHPSSGRAMLTALADQGSTLAMMYIGHSLANSKDECERALGEDWLIRSAMGGSVEGRFQLFAHYERQEKGEKAVAELMALVATGYAPAMYALGLTLYNGKLVKQDMPEAVKYLKMAKKAGHLPATGLLAWIYRKEDFGISGRVVAHWYCLAKIPSLIWLLLRYPRSDRLRGITLPDDRNRIATRHP